MAEIQVEYEGEEMYRVRVEEPGGTSSHLVRVPAEQAERYGGDVEETKLLEASFRFLLEREPKEAILSRFELSDIEGYFPEYPEEIRQRLG